MNKTEALARQQALVNQARAEGRSLTPEEQAEFDRCQAVIDGAEGEPDGGQRGAADPADPIQQAIAAERQRMAEITSLCRQTGMEAEPYIRSGAAMDEVRQAAVTFLIQHNGPVGARFGGPDQQQDFRQAASDALLMRGGLPVSSPSEEAYSMQRLSLRDMAIECMAREGVGTTTELLRMSKDDLWDQLQRQFLSPSAAFPAILDNTIRKTIVQRYQAAPTTFQLWTSEGTLTDFKASKDHEYLLGGGGDFELVAEGGELKHDTLKTELLPQRKLSTYGRQFSMTREAFVNDDIGLITEMPGKYAAAARRTINKQVYSILMKNPAIFDGVALFDEAHGNLISTGGAPSIDTMQAIMLKLLSQTDPFGDSIMVQPQFVIVPVGYGFRMAQILESPQIEVEGIGSHTANALYQYRNTLVTVEEGTINTLAGKGAALPWFMAGNPATGRSIQVDYLNGMKTPSVRRSQPTGQLGFVWDMWLDWGVSVVDYRGIAKNPGTTLSL